MTDQRRADLAKIHLAKKQLNLSDEAYRDLLWVIARVSSAADLDEFGRKNELKAALITENGGGPICLPSLVEVHLQRVIQEALTNVRRHADASRVEVHLRQSAAGWNLMVMDDGAGFDYDQLSTVRQESYGLSTMRERVESIGGRFSIDSRPGAGTRVNAFVPCNSKDQD